MQNDLNALDEKAALPADPPSRTNKRSLKQTWDSMLRLTLFRMRLGVDHEEVIEHVHEEGELTGRYIFMVLMSCAIAMLGLLLSSPAVVIGAMLISPLMGPIMLLGFSLTILDVDLLKKSLVSSLIGVAAAILIAFLITLASPLSEATPEIMARTRPNFFDLLVAIFSGLAGGYAVITRKGEAIVGVAIATALMPPLAIVGYGLAVGSMPIAGGAFFLFMTNLLAIALSVTVLSLLYGFTAHYGRRQTVGQALLIIGVFAALSVPLGFALRDISYETHVSNIVKAEILRPFEDVQSRLGEVHMDFPKGADLGVQATVLTKVRVPMAQQILTDTLSQKLGRPINVTLDQVLINRDVTLERAEYLELANSSLAAPIRAEMLRIEGLSELRRGEAELRNAVPFSLAGANIEPETQTARLFAARQPGYAITTYQSLETGLSENFLDWQITLVPPLMDLPRIGFSTSEDELTADMMPALNTAIWALRRWDVTAVEVVGYASTSGALRNFNNQELAYRRAEAAAQYLREQGFEADPIGEYRAFRQDEEELELGTQRFQSVLIRPIMRGEP